MRSPIVMTDSIRPITLTEIGQEPAAYSPAIITGWGDVKVMKPKKQITISEFGNITTLAVHAQIQKILISLLILHNDTII